MLIHNLAELRRDALQADSLVAEVLFGLDVDLAVIFEIFDVLQSLFIRIKGVEMLSKLSERQDELKAHILVIKEVVKSFVVVAFDYSAFLNNFFDPSLRGFKLAYQLI